MPFDGVAPAVVNAICSLGLDIRSVPATPERIMEAPAVAAATSSSGFGAASPGLGTRDSGLEARAGSGRTIRRKGGRA
jgi:hypothetical protein